MTVPRTTRRALVLGVAVLLVAGLFAAPVAGHAFLSDSSPANGEQLDVPPDEVSLEFTGDGVQLAEVSITGPGGTDVSGDATVDRADAQRVTVPMDDDGEGVYVVEWRVLADDGHTTTGSFFFTVGDEPVDRETVVATIEAEEAEGIAPGEAIARAIILVSLVGVLGLGFARLLGVGRALKSGGTTDRRARLAVDGALTRWLTVGAMGLLVGFLALGIVRTVGMGGVSPGALERYLGTSLGRLWLVQLALGSGLLAAVAIGRRGGRFGRRAWLATTALSVLLSLTVAVTSHSAVNVDQLQGTAVDLVHLLGAGLWFGAVLALALALPRLRAHGSECAGEDGEEGLEAGGPEDSDGEGDGGAGARGDEVGAEGHGERAGGGGRSIAESAHKVENTGDDGSGGSRRYSAQRARLVGSLATLALAGVVTVVSTGLVIASWHAPFAGGWMETPYGIVLIAKLGLVALAIVLGGLTRFVHLPRLLAGDRSDTAEVGPVVALSGMLAIPGLFGRSPGADVERTVRLEVVVLVVVLALSGVMTSAPTVAMEGHDHDVPEAIFQDELDELEIELTVIPAYQALDTALVPMDQPVVFEVRFGPEDDPRESDRPVRLLAVNDETDTTLEVELERTEDGAYATVLPLSESGQWELRFDAFVDGTQVDVWYDLQAEDEDLLVPAEDEDFTAFPTTFAVRLRYLAGLVAVLGLAAVGLELRRLRRFDPHP